jgi:hypothetical protein
MDHTIVLRMDRSWRRIQSYRSRPESHGPEYWQTVAVELGPMSFAILMFMGMGLALHDRSIRLHDRVRSIEKAHIFHLTASKQRKLSSFLLNINVRESYASFFDHGDVAVAAHLVDCCLSMSPSLVPHSIGGEAPLLIMAPCRFMP